MRKNTTLAMAAALALAFAAHGAAAPSRSPPSKAGAFISSSRNDDSQMRDALLRLRYRYWPDHLLGEILSKRWTETAVPVIVLPVVDRGGTCAARCEAEGLAFRALVTALDLGFAYEGGE